MAVGRARSYPTRTLWQLGAALGSWGQLWAALANWTNSHNHSLFFHCLAFKALLRERGGSGARRRPRSAQRRRQGAVRQVRVHTALDPGCPLRSSS